MKYSFLIGLKKALIQVIIVGVPVAIQLLPTDVLNLTLGGTLALLINYFKIQNTIATTRTTR